MSTSFLNLSKGVFNELWQAAVVMAIGFVIGVLLFTQCSSPQPAQTSPEIDMLLHGVAQLTQKIDENGRQITKTQNALVTPEYIRANNDSIYRQIKTEIGRNVRNLQARQHLSTVTRIVEQVAVRDTDTVLINGELIKAQTFQFRDPWTRISGLVLPTDSVRLDFETRADLTVNHYWERRLFKPDVLHAKLTTDNPHLRVNRFATMQVPHEPAWHQTPAFRIASNVSMFAAGFVTGVATQ